MSTSSKKFVLSHRFDNIQNMKEKDFNEGPEEIHFDVTWRLQVAYGANYAAVYLDMTNPDDLEEGSIEAEYTFKIISVNGKSFTDDTKHSNFDYWKTACHGSDTMKWDEFMEIYVIDGSVTIEASVQIMKMNGIKRIKLRTFDETMQQFSNVILVVRGEKFHVLKQFLASHSKYFNTLFLGKFEESEKSEVELKDIDPEDFQNFLEVLHGESAINDDTIAGILHLNDMYDAPTAHRRCEEFLMKESGKSLKEKLELSTKYNMNLAKSQFISKIESLDDIRSILPGKLEEMDHSLIATVLQKSLEFQQPDDFY